MLRQVRVCKKLHQRFALLNTSKRSFHFFDSFLKFFRSFGYFLFRRIRLSIIYFWHFNFSFSLLVTYSLLNQSSSLNASFIRLYFSTSIAPSISVSVTSYSFVSQPIRSFKLLTTASIRSCLSIFSPESE